MATMFKDAGAAINVANKGGDTPLLAAVAAGNLELVKSESESERGSEEGGSEGGKETIGRQDTLLHTLHFTTHFTAIGRKEKTWRCRSLGVEPRTVRCTSRSSYLTSRSSYLSLLTVSHLRGN